MQNFHTTQKNSMKNLHQGRQVGEDDRNRDEWHRNYKVFTSLIITFIRFWAFIRFIGFISKLWPELLTHQICNLYSTEYMRVEKPFFWCSDYDSWFQDLFGSKWIFLCIMIILPASSVIPVLFPAEVTGFCDSASVLILAGFIYSLERY